MPHRRRRIAMLENGARRALGLPLLGVVDTVTPGVARAYGISPTARIVVPLGIAVESDVAVPLTVKHARASSRVSAGGHVTSSSNAMSGVPAKRRPLSGAEEGLRGLVAASATVVATTDWEWSSFGASVFGLVVWWLLGCALARWRWR